MPPIGVQKWIHAKYNIKEMCDKYDRKTSNINIFPTNESFSYQAYNLYDIATIPGKTILFYYSI